MDAKRKRLVLGAATAAAVAVAVLAGLAAVLLSDPTGEGGSRLGPDFEYDLEKLREVDEALIKYEEVGAIAAGLEEVRALAVGPNDRVYVAGDRAAKAFDPGGEALWETSLPGEPQCLAVVEDGEEGTVYVGLADHIEVLDARGRALASWKSPGEDALILSLAVSEEHVFAADAGAKVVHRYDRSGDLLGRIGEKDETRNIPGIAVYQPCLDLALGPDGLLRVTNPGQHRVHLYAPEGELVAWWGGYSAGIEGFCGCCNPVNIAVLDDGRTVTAEKSLPRVKVYDDRGRFEAVVAGPDDFEGTPSRLDVAVDSGRRVLVLDPGSGKVRIFARKPEATGAADE